MKNIFFAKAVTALFLICYVMQLPGQDRVLLEIDNEKIMADEFVHIYEKNNINKEAANAQNLHEYMDLFVNFKLKIHEATAMQLDTMTSFRQELDGYRTQLAQPYLTDKNVEKALIQEAYERMREDIRVSHILVRTGRASAPADTLKAWNKIQEVYAKLQKGEDFATLSATYSDDEAVRENGGDMGYHTVFGLDYDFENMMYSTPVGSFSKPFRTRFGYHIIKVTDRRPAKGRYKVAHIMFITPEGCSSRLVREATAKADSMLLRARAGDDFAALAKKYSQDKRTARDGGEVGWITVGGRYIRPFEEAVFSLNNVGDMTSVKTKYSIHVIKLLEKEEVGTFDQMKKDIVSKISTTARMEKSKTVVLDRLKKDYNARTDTAALAEFYTLVTDSIFKCRWTPPDDANLSKPLFSFADKVYTQRDFSDYLIKYSRKQMKQKIGFYVDKQYKNFVDKMLMLYEEGVLERKYPEFHYLVKEYHDGILLFALTDKEIWSKAVADTVGLKAFHAANMDKYKWNYRYLVQTFKCKSPKIAKKMLKMPVTADATKMLEKFNKSDSAAVVKLSSLLAEKGSNDVVDKVIEQYKIPAAKFEKSVYNADDSTVVRMRVLMPMPKTLNEAKGIVTADYQNHLEKQWLENLKKKYKIVVHDDVLNSLMKY